MNYSVNFSLLKNFGLSLNDKKRYFMIYDPQTWSLSAVYDNLKDACEFYGETVDDWEKICEKNEASTCQYTQKYSKDFVGHNYIFNKGFYQNLSVWELLHQLRDHILDPYLGFDEEDAIYFTMTSIDEKMVNTK